MSEAKNEELSFEEAMNQLEAVVEQLEQGDVPLEQAISMFQEGMALSKQCHTKLEKVEAQMEQILHEDGELEKLQSVGTGKSESKTKHILKRSKGFG